MRTFTMLLAFGCAAMAQAPVTNYDEAKVPAYTLPPLLVMNDGAPVRSASGWAARRAEILGLLETQMFGRAPARPDGMTFAVESVEKAALGGKAVRKQVSIKARGLSLRLLLYLPAKAARPVPVFVGLGFSPNQSVSADTGICLAGAWAQNKETRIIEVQPADESSRGAAAARWQVDDDARARLRPGDDVLRRHRAGHLRRHAPRRARRPPESWRADAGWRRMGRHRGVGVGAEPHRGLPRDATRMWTRAGWPLSATRGSARRRSGRAPWTRASASSSRTTPAKAVRRSAGGSSARRWPT